LALKIEIAVCSPTGRASLKKYRILLESLPMASICSRSVVAQGPEMDEEIAFPELLRRVRLGDQDAAVELVRRYEPAIRRAVRIKLVDSRLAGALDSMDVCQSVMGSFFYRAALGQYEMEKPEDLVRLLVTMARNKLTDHVRKQTTERRGKGMTRRTDFAAVDIAGADPTASRVVSAREVLEAALGRLSDEERWIAEQRTAGRAWAELAAELGSTPEAVRKKHARALDRVSRELGLDDSSG
jgi:RNA polymerase sigma factor (sigma-70 family)